CCPNGSLSIISNHVPFVKYFLKLFLKFFRTLSPATRVSAAVDFQFTRFILPCQALFRSFFLFFRLFSSRSQSAANFFIFARAIGLFRLFLSSKNRFFLRFFALLGASQASSPAPSHFLPYYIYNMPPSFSEGSPPLRKGEEKLYNIFGKLKPFSKKGYLSSESAF
ncbi:MAG: hypothetical protein IJC84_03535, partial [Clostridia bacterium]|nr:hypothetical protein [Clostridia bacterium]